MVGEEPKGMFTLVVGDARSVFEGTPEEADKEAQRLAKLIDVKDYKLCQHKLIKVI